jgi:cellulose synthase operon protein C
VSRCARVGGAVAVAVHLALLAGCAHQAAVERGRGDTLAALRKVQPDTTDVRVDNGLEKAMESYRRFLQETPAGALTPEAMRRLADLQLERDFGVRGTTAIVVDAPPPRAEIAIAAVAAAPQPVELAAPAATTRVAAGVVGKGSVPAAAAVAADTEQQLEQRAAAGSAIAAATTAGAASAAPAEAGPLEAIQLYDELLAKFPNYAFRDQVLYQKARAYDELGRTEEAMAVMEQLVRDNPNSRLADEVQFRRGENLFTHRKYRDAQNAYQTIVTMGAASEYYELALYKLGWSLYKQDAYEEALHRYFALLDHKVSKGYDFDAKHVAAEERRVEDTFQVTALSFSNLGGPEVIHGYFKEFGHRPYEDRAYRYLGEFYLGKRRYNDAAVVYKDFVGQYPFHARAPDFSMRTIGIYEAAGFPQLVLEAKKGFAASYGLTGEYWRHQDLAKRPEVVAALKTNLTDLAGYYHAQYQDPKQAEHKRANYAEATRWYRDYLESFHDDAQAPAANYQFADLLRENGDFAGAAVQYERTAYDYAGHDKAAAAGYAAIYAHRENLKVVAAAGSAAARRATVVSSLRFADNFPQHAEAPTVLVAAAQDLYDMKDFAPARAAGNKLLASFPAAAPGLQRTAWTVVAHASFELAEFPLAEQAYGQVLARTPEGEAGRADLIENLAASIYRQGERANEAGDYRTAANHFLRIKDAAPTAKIRAGAQYDAGAALVRLQDWKLAAQVLDEFRRDHPAHQLAQEATRQIANAYRQAGALASSAGEYERVVNESTDPELRAEALLLAGRLYEEAQDVQRALAAYTRYVREFPNPVEGAVEARQRMADIHKARSDDAGYRAELQQIVQADAAAGAGRTGRTRTLAGRAALVLAEPLYAQFTAIELRQPFEKSLDAKQKAMQGTLNAFDALVGYEVADVTAAATWYLAEVYAGFSRALVDSERPSGLAGAALQDYNDQLDETAFPFEEKAIALHEKNMELMAAGVYGTWIDRSLSRLAELKPARYARTEMSSGFLGSPERYEYVRPVPPPPAAPDASAAMPPTIASNGVADASLQ